ncbi:MULTISPECIES: ABC transporter permease [unclassified Ruminococcus]|uniref:ABC transporter permease n=1 Tax=unclassified Ruminococcus TaxID=2608920 RepID=UPI00210B6B34|nr:MULTISPECIES: ABC transporter permease [unclassified Ruminococcus]MCQ4022072.1 ABC transporter permease [Ruminococcus sp. zg-924]MCQ4114392.1 ABC transporter permease [Ruminococcus sp. zg-921]
MSSLSALIRRNTKLFFKDKGMFFTSLITPIILLVLYATFLANVFRSSFVDALPKGFNVSDGVIDGLVGSQLISSLLAVCCVTVAFMSNMLMVQDKVTGALSDLTITPVKRSTLALGYYISTAVSTLIICFIAVGAGLIYLANVGWYMSVSDIPLIFIDVFLLVMFGTALSSIINFFLSSQGQISAVGTIISAGYGFICGAYMPISSFSEGLQNVLSFLPGTYGTALIRNHTMNGVFNELSDIGFPSEVIENIKDGIDCNIYFFGDKVEESTMYLILGGSVVALVAIYIIINVLKRK